MKKNVYTVEDVNRYIKNMFSQDFMMRNIYIKGEVSNCKYHSSGHIYLTLKDGSGSLRAIMFAGNANKLTKPMKDGDRIIGLGSIEVYEAAGTYQFYLREVILDGQGDLNEKFQKLKQELEEMGMFSPEYKKAIPSYSRKVGVITAPTGAAVRDIQMIAQRRNPYVQLILCPVLVQGIEAKDSIVDAIRRMDQLGLDVIILGRGGGSIEDLWAFNEEIVARAVFECQTPIITGVGHETDTTIVDYVADLRASTPSAAAEIAVFSLVDWVGRLHFYEQRYRSEMKRHLQKSNGRLSELQFRLEKKNPSVFLNSKKMQLTDLESRMKRIFEDNLSQRIIHLQVAAERLEGTSPLKKMKQGFGFITDQKGKAVKSICEIENNQILNIDIQDGKIKVEVLETKDHRYEL